MRLKFVTLILQFWRFASLLTWNTVHWSQLQAALLAIRMRTAPEALVMAKATTFETWRLTGCLTSGQALSAFGNSLLQFPDLAATAVKQSSGQHHGTLPWQLGISCHLVLSGIGGLVYKWLEYALLAFSYPPLFPFPLVHSIGSPSKLQPRYCYYEPLSARTLTHCYFCQFNHADPDCHISCFAQSCHTGIHRCSRCSGGWRSTGPPWSRYKSMGGESSMPRATVSVAKSGCGTTSSSGWCALEQTKTRPQSPQTRPQSPRSAQSP